MKTDFYRRALIGLNLGLAAAAVILAWRDANSAPATTGTPVSVATKPLLEAAPALPHYPESAPPAEQRRWLVDQLRAMGVPNQVLARVVMKDLDQRWNKYAAEVSLKTCGDPEVLAALNLKIERSRDADMRAALGEKGFKEWDAENMRREVDVGKIAFSPSENDAAYALWKKLQQSDLELRERKAKGEIDQAGENDAYAQDLAQFQQQMRALLGDTRYAQSQGIGSGVLAANLRQDLANANPTESQFQELLDTQQQYNDLRANLTRQSHDDAAYEQSLKDLDEARDEEYRRVLGPDAFDALQKQQDVGYSAMKKYENLWGLDDTKVDYVYSALKYYQKSADDYQTAARDLAAKGQTVDWDAVNKNLQQFAQQTRQSLQGYLGQDSFDKLLQNGVVHLDRPVGDMPNTNNGRPF